MGSRIVSACWLTVEKERERWVEVGVWAHCCWVEGLEGGGDVRGSSMMLTIRREFLPPLLPPQWHAEDPATPSTSFTASRSAFTMPQRHSSSHAAQKTAVSSVEKTTCGISSRGSIASWWTNVEP